MSKKYDVYITPILGRRYFVEAENKQEAENKAKAKFLEEKIRDVVPRVDEIRCVVEKFDDEVGNE